MTEILYRKVELPDGTIQFVPAPERPADHRLAVPWVGQNTTRSDDDYTRSDCGAAVVTGWLHYRGKTSVSVDDVSRATGKPPNYPYTVFADLDKAANAFGLDLVHQFGTLILPLVEYEIDIARPVIALVHYPSLPIKFDPTYQSSHWILITGYGPDLYYYNDPYWPTAERGADILISASQLTDALRNVNLNGNTPFQGATQK